MANLVRRNREQAGGVPTLVWEPFRLMREMMSWDPFRAIEAGSLVPSAVGAFSPEFDVKEMADAYVIEADLPGVEEKDVDVNLSGNQLSISGKRESTREEDGTTYYAYERSYGSFTRAFTVPEGVDTENVQAELKNGVLTVHLPKKAEVKPKRISLSGIVDKVKSLTAGPKPTA